MRPDAVRRQIDDVLARLIKASLAVKQFSPSYTITDSGGVSIGDVRETSIAMRNTSYELIYNELERHNAYHVKLVDGGLLLFQYLYDPKQILLKHRLGFFPSPVLPAADEAPELYERDELYGDIVAQNIVRFPIRFDYIVNSVSSTYHPSSHLTLGQYENCRIPVAGPMGPNAFALFIVRNFYFRSYQKSKNRFDQRPIKLDWSQCITEADRLFTHMVHGR